MKNIKIIVFSLILSLSFIVSGCYVSIGGTSQTFNEVYKSQVIKENVSPIGSVDEKNLTNYITNKAMSGVLTVYCQNNYEVFGFLATSSSVSQGSAGIFHYDGTYYYALTNSHVVKENSSAQQNIYVETNLGERYSAWIYESPKKSNNAISVNYDLAVICFKAPRGLKVFKFTNANPNIGSEIVLLGTPSGQKNAIYYGDIISYIYPKFTEEDSDILIDFQIIKYTANATNGSSGGPLLDGNLNIIGVHFGGNTSADSEEFSGAVPTLKVLEFLDNFFWVV